ncbi:MAG: signal peptidase II [Treponema sp.]|jgi:lipoprotein signal peptidase|nr:signal peptidase II [Treponema sp.]
MKNADERFLLLNVLPIVLAFTIGVIISYFAYNDTKPSFAKIVIGIIGLCLIDQTIKLYIVNNQDISIAIVSDWLGIKVAHNTYQSAVFALFEKVMPARLHLLLIPVCYMVFRFCYFYQKDSRSLLSLTVILIYAASICAFIDTIVYGGSYDYILLYPLFIFDLKDCFVLTGLSTMFLTLIRNKSWPEIKKEFLGDLWGIKYYKYEADTWRSLIGKLTSGRKAGIALPETPPAPEQAASKDEHI